ncbi:MAG: glycosyltransferase family 2 protein [Crenarchaeota archaeon]|nr:glycosyltransferase family 2 protein [Thermoproteota archaeon]
MLADAALLLAALYHALGALYYKAAEKVPKEKVFTFPSLAVHVPAYKEDPEMLRRTVEAIKVRLNPEEIIVISDSESFEVLRKALPDYVLLLKGAEKGKAWALNEALKYTRSEYVMVFDADSYPDEGFSLVKAHFSGSLWKGYSSGTRWSEAIAKVTTSASVALVYGRRRLGFPVFPPGSGLMIKKELLERARWDERALTEDLELAARLLGMGVEAEANPSFVLVEAPPSYAALKRQQARWAYGAVEVLKRHFKSLIRKPESLFYLTQHFVTWLPLAALLLSPMGLSPASLLFYYSSVALQAYFAKRAERAWGIEVGLADSARASAAGLAMSIRLLRSTLEALLGLEHKWVVTPKGKRARVGGELRGSWEEAVLLLTPLAVPLNPISLPLALQYFASALFVMLE